MFWKKKLPNSNTSAQPNAAGPGYELLVRSPREVATRVLALLAVVGRTHENSLYDITGWVDGNEIAAFFSANERAYFSRESATEAQRIDFSWRSEAVVPLIWALCGLADFPALDSQFDIWENEMVRVALKTPGSFIASAELRDSNAIETQEQKLYQEHWRVRDAQLFGREMPPDLEPLIVYERRYALSWLVGWGDDWDDVPTDT